MDPTTESMVMACNLILSSAGEVRRLVGDRAALDVVAAVGEEDVKDDMVIRRRVALRNGRCVVNNNCGFVVVAGSPIMAEDTGRMCCFCFLGCCFFFGWRSSSSDTNNAAVVVCGNVVVADAGADGVSASKSGIPNVGIPTGVPLSMVLLRLFSSSSLLLLTILFSAALSSFILVSDIVVVAGGALYEAAMTWKGIDLCPSCSEKGT